jgi:hypothetical protein
MERHEDLSPSFETGKLFFKAVTVPSDSQDIEMISLEESPSMGFRLWWMKTDGPLRATWISSKLDIVVRIVTLAVIEFPKILAF